MKFVDTTTPTNQQYQDNAQNYSQKGNETTRQRANDWSTMYYQNAYNTAMLNYMNEYNSPLQQMLRYQEAGINPFLVGQDPGNMGSAPGGAAPKGSADRGPTQMDILGGSLDSMNTVANLMKSAQGIYDYINYGRDMSDVQTKILKQQLSKYQAEADWSLYWNYGQDFGPNSVYVQGSPRAKYMQESTERISSQIEQLKALVKVIYPSQEQQNKAKTALTDLQKAILEGQKGAVLKINTGSNTVDSILQMICYWLLNK